MFFSFMRLFCCYFIISVFLQQCRVCQPGSVCKNAFLCCPFYQGDWKASKITFRKQPGFLYPGIFLS